MKVTSTVVQRTAPEKPQSKLPHGLYITPGGYILFSNGMYVMCVNSVGDVWKLGEMKAVSELAVSQLVPFYGVVSLSSTE